MNNVERIASKELSSFFSSLTAFIFFGAFLAVTLFIFFWVDTFFARNLADVRPMFEWLPLLFIFLVPALTMRMWSEERRSGTLEFLLTVPVTNLDLVLGKFFACMGLVVIALALTIPIPLTVALFAGQIDWGPVIGGYVAALFLAASYTAIGLNISARTDNQIVSLLFSVLVCGLFLLIGSDGVSGLFNNNVADLLRLFGSGSRFQSITRGVIDFRDLYYYLSITGVFLTANVLALEKLRWSGNKLNASHKRWLLVTALCMVNFVAGNFWLQQIGWARVDLTEGQIYSISPATRKYLDRLQEPLIIRGYFSKKIHPLLQPLIPQLRDLLKEYVIAGKGKVRVEFIDPLEKPELEKEASEKYGIKPVVFQTATKYQSALTNSYFDILIKYGDQFQKINWKQLVEVKARTERDIRVDLRNPEYDITSAIKKLLYGYQSSGNLFLSIDKPVKFTGYISPDSQLPEPLIGLKKLLNESLDTLKKDADGKLSVEFVDPDANGGKIAKKLESTYGFRPMAMGLTDSKSFWFYMTMQCGNQVVEVPLPQQMQKMALDSGIQSGLKRFSKGFLKTIGISAPQFMVQYGMPPRDDYSMLKEGLSDSYIVRNASLDMGVVPADVDVLLLIEPTKYSEKALFAIDQFLMKGGTVILATAPFDVSIDKTIACKKIDSGLEKWLSNYGIDLQKTMVLDTHNFPLPIPAHRSVAGIMVEETQLVPYPYFVDIRGDGLSTEGNISAGLNQLIVDWASPISIDKEKNKNRRVINLLQSSLASWTSDSTNMDPHYTKEQPYGFPIGKDQGKKLLGVVIEGSFPSFFNKKKEPSVTNFIDKSPESARIFLFASNSFLSDKLMWLASASIGSHYTKPIELIQNAADWSLEDRDLLTIRGRGHFARTLVPMTQGFEIFFEYLNYALAILGLVIVWLVRRRCWQRSQRRFDQLLQTISTEQSLEKEEVRS